MIELARHIRAIQEIDLCHGDIHSENITFNISEKEGDVLHPVVSARVIDFGNAFTMERGKNVSEKWINGDRNLIPP